MRSRTVPYTVRGGRDATGGRTIAGRVGHITRHAHDAHRDHLVRGTRKDARVTPDDAADVGLLVQYPDLGTGKVLARGTRDVGPVHDCPC